jgi:hypothetical protein
MFTFRFNHIKHHMRWWLTEHNGILSRLNCLHVGIDRSFIPDAARNRHERSVRVNGVNTLGAILVAQQTSQFILGLRGLGHW